MSALTKKHPTKSDENTIVVQLAGPENQLQNIEPVLEKHGFHITGKTKLHHDSIPWREVFYDFEDKEIPAACLKAARMREEMTQKELSKRSGIDQGHISAMENGKRAIGVESAKKLAKVLNTDYRVLL